MLELKRNICTKEGTEAIAGLSFLISFKAF